ncbi:uncharacterized protein LOC136072284 [Hydra vulgaris]|uniref:uncharacterized protein LOC136072284 n=1 Tax=Hydra vulgaris TaxID=6087 RepID=UPI0032EA7905
MYDKPIIVDILNMYFRSEIWKIVALVKSYLSKLDTNKSDINSGYNEVNPYVLKFCSEKFSISLSIIYQQSLLNSDLHDHWEMANVCPVFINGSKLQTINYRPVSLTPMPCKVLEKIISDERLISKLCGYGIEKEMLNWIKAYLSNRKQRFIIGDTKSDWLEVRSGVQQDSVLGPLLFLLYVNGLPSKLNNKRKLYADDNKIIAIVNNQINLKSLQDHINN